MTFQRDFFLFILTDHEYPRMTLRLRDSGVYFCV